jgi:hypothetical protein
MVEFLNETVMPEWKLLLGNISGKERRIGVIQKGEKFVWTEFFKDLRKFFRLIFKLRFHRCDKRKDSNRRVLIDTVLHDLGITASEYDTNEIFYFFYPYLNKLRKENIVDEKFKSNYFSQVFATYNDRNKKRFVYDLLGSQLL